MQGFTKTKIKPLLKSLAFYLDKQKSFIPQKNLKCTMDSSFFSHQMSYYLNSPSIYGSGSTIQFYPEFKNENNGFLNL